MSKLKQQLKLNEDHNLLFVSASSACLTVMIIAILCMISCTPIMAQTTFTESGASFNINPNGAKDGGHAFCDFDLDGDFDLLVNRNNRSFLYRNNGNGTFTDVTNALAPALTQGRRLSAIWGDLNNDGYPDFARNASNEIQIFLQDPATGVFGDGIGGTDPQIYRSDASGNFRIEDGLNSEGMGFLDYNGDGFLDLIFDNHNFGVDLLENDGTGHFFQVTAMQPGFSYFNPATWPVGLVQSASDGDFSATTDYNNDGWVDFLARKRGQVDLFTNLGGHFESLVDLAQASNANKGGVAFADFDNDGDFDMIWTEEGDTQIFENVNGTLVAMGSITGIPTSFGGNRPDGVVCGDIDNDGDIDIFIAGRQSGMLFINQQNHPILGPNTGSPMTFVQASETFYSGQGRGCSMVDIDNDGDLDIYVNINNGNNRLFINNLNGTASDNYLFVDVLETRAIANIPSGVYRPAVGANVRLVDCDGNVIAGIADVNGGNGRGTQNVSRVHFGLPNGPDTEYVLQTFYPNIAGHPRMQVNQEIRPSDFANRLVTVIPPLGGEEPPVAEDDYIFYMENTPIIIDVLADNGAGADTNPSGGALVVLEGLGLTAENGTVELNDDGTVTYTPNADFNGMDSFTYTVSNSNDCAASGLTAEATVHLIYAGSPDNCVIGFNPFTWSELPANDDDSVGPIALPFDFDLYGTTYNSVFLNNNGNVSFDNPYWWYTSTGFPITTPMIAPFWGDVDTRDWFANGYQGEVWYTVTPTSFIVTWMNVGPYNAANADMNDLQNTFTLVMTDGTDPILEPGNNVGFFYGNMDWTTGQASGGGNDGFGGSPATVGINSGNGTDYILIGMFNEDSDNYDGPHGENDGVDWLENQCLEFNVASAENFPPVAQQFPFANTVNVCYGASTSVTVGFTGPESDETVTIAVEDNGFGGVSIGSNNPGNPALATLNIQGTAIGTHVIDVVATDDHVNPETTIRQLTINVIDCDCSGAPVGDCIDVVETAPVGSCEAFVSIDSPSLTLDCFSQTAANFTTNNGYISFEDPLEDDFTIEFWFKPASAVWSGTFYDMSSTSNGGQNRHFFIDGSNNNIRWSYRGVNGGTSTINANMDFSEERWYHVAATGGFGSNEQRRLYVDGVQVGTNNGMIQAKSDTYSQPRIGRHGTAHHGVTQSAFSGLIDNFRVYDIRLSQAQVDQVACETLAGLLNNIRVAYDFEEASGTVANDLSVYNNNGTFISMGANPWASSDVATACSTSVNDYTGTDDASATYPVGSTTVNWTFTSASGNTSNCSQVVTVLDIEAPEAVCQDIIVELDENGLATIDPADVDAGSSDNCGIAFMTLDNDSFDCSDMTSGVTIASGNGYEVHVALNPIAVNAPAGPCPWGFNYTVTMQYEITFTGDNIPANLWTLQGTVGCGPNTHFFGLPNSSGSGTSISANSYSSGTDCATATPISMGCNAITLEIHGPGIPNTFINVPPIGNPVTLTVGDASGNTDSCTANVTVVDNMDPVAICQDFTVVLNGSGQASISPNDIDAGSYDNCGIANLSLSQTNFTCSDLGTNTVTLTATDTSGNTGICTATVTVIDDEAPVISCNPNLTVATTSGICSATPSLANPSVSDNCSNVVITNDAPPSFPLGTTVVTWTATDAAGNNATCQQTVTVVDSENPTIVCPANITTSANAGQCFATVALGTPSTDDNCGIASVSNDAPATFPIGSTTVTWTVVDNAGNTATCEQTVTVGDNEAPTIECPADLTTDNDLGQCFATIILDAPVVDDNCTVDSVTNDAPATFPIGLTTVTWTVTDNVGNSATCEQVVTVEDNELPTITCAADVTVSADADQCFATVVLVDPATTDNCGVASVSNDAPATFPIGLTTVTWTVTDNAGNTATCEQTVTVEDNEAPTIECPADLTTDNDLGQCFATIILDAPVVDDNCTVASVTNDAPATFPIGSTTVTWTVTDNAGNTTTCEQIVTVEDNELPTITCAADVTVSADADQCFATVVLVDPATADNCGVASVSNDAPATFPIGLTTVTWTVTDNAGNTATCEQTVTVEDNEAPTIECPADLTTDNDLGQCFATIILDAPVVDDNCTVVL